MTKIRETYVFLIFCRIFRGLKPNVMKTKVYLIALAAMLSSMSLSAQEVLRYEGQWPKGEGILYSSRDGLIIGTFSNGVPEGRCICYLPSGEVYWGNYKKGKATGYGSLYRDNGIVMSGEFKNGKYHGTDTLYRRNGSMFVGKFRKGRLKSRISNFESLPSGLVKPEYPMVDLNYKQEEFLKELEIRWEQRNRSIIESAGFVTPRFQGGDVDDFALWVNSRVEVPRSFNPEYGSRTVLVEFTVLDDGSVADVHAVFGSNVELNDAAVKAVSKSPIWEPGMFDGQKKSTRLTVPVVFGGE